MWCGGTRVKDCEAPKGRARSSSLSSIPPTKGEQAISTTLPALPRPALPLLPGAAHSHGLTVKRQLPKHRRRQTGHAVRSGAPMVESGPGPVSQYIKCAGRRTGSHAAGRAPGGWAQLHELKAEHHFRACLPLPSTRAHRGGRTAAAHATTIAANSRRRATTSPPAAAQ